MTRNLDSPSSHLSIEQPFDLASSLESGQAHRWWRDRDNSSGSPGEWYWGVIGGNVIRVRTSNRAWLGGPYGLEIRSAPPVDGECLEHLMRTYFRLDDDIEAIYREITRDPRVELMVSRYRGLRLLSVEPWECLISFICSANSNMSRIHANMEAMAESFGEPVTLDGRVVHTFPTPQRLAAAGELALRSLGLGFRAPYVARAASAVADGELDLEGLRLLPYQEAKLRLVELPGIGSKIADCVLLHSLDKMEAFPIDVWVRRALREWYFDGEKPPSDRLMLEWATEYFGPYAGYAELYLFHGRRLDKGLMNRTAE